VFILNISDNERKIQWKNGLPHVKVPGLGWFVIVPAMKLGRRSRSYHGARLFASRKGLTTPSSNAADGLKYVLSKDDLNTMGFSVIVVMHYPIEDVGGLWFTGLRVNQMEIVRFPALPSMDTEWRNHRRGFVFGAPKLL